MQTPLRGSIRNRALVLFLLLASIANAAPPSHYLGRDFILGYMPGIEEGNPAVTELQLTSDVGALVTVEYPMGAPTFTRTLFIPPESTITVPLPGSASRGWSNGVVQRNAVRVVTTDPPPARFGATMIDRVRFLADTAIAVPADRIGTDYVIVTPEVEPFPTGGKPQSEFVVIARDNGTTVTIVPTEDVHPAHFAGVPFTVSLDAGEGFLAHTIVPMSTISLTGSTVVADKPVAVTNGDGCARVPQGNGACNAVFEVALPTTAWGHKIPVFELPERPAGTYYRVVAGTNGTAVTLDGTPLTTLNRGQFFDVPAATGAHMFGGDQPIFVVQLQPGGSLHPSFLGDPAMGNMLPVEQFGRLRSFTTPGIGQFDNHWVTIIAESDDAAAGAVALDGTPISPAAFTTIPASTFSVATLAVAPGHHRTESRGLHHVTAEGMDKADAYLHPVAGRRPIDHYLCHSAKNDLINRTVTLADALGSGTVSLRGPRSLCAPADKRGEGVIDPATHLLAYKATGFDTKRVAVDVTDQFGTLTLDLGKTTGLLVPALKTHPPEPQPPAPDPALHEVDHYRCIDVRRSSRAPQFVQQTVAVADQFGATTATLKKPDRLCIPTDKNGEGIRRSDDVLLCYTAKVTPALLMPTVQTTDQFGPLPSEKIGAVTELCVPATLARTTCCEPRTTRCKIGGVDAGPCDLPALLRECRKAGGICESVSCDLLCGDGTVDPFCCEECDDGTRLEGDGCSAGCKAQACCIPQPQRCQGDESVPCDDAVDCARAGVGGACITVSCEDRCGNGLVEDFCCEPCDDGNDCHLPCHEEEPCVPSPCRCLNNSGIACPSGTGCPVGDPCVCYDCPSLCGNGEQDDFCCEECDSGVPGGADDCSGECLIVECVPQPCRCANNHAIDCNQDSDCPSGAGGCICFDCGSLCGDHVIEPWCCEQCDDGTRLDGDGCSATCEIQPCCVPQPTRCSGNLAVPCDDQNDCTITGSGNCISVSCDFACGDDHLQGFCCEQCDDGDTCYGYFPDGVAGIPFP